jgi:hypothetical protein
MTKEQPELIDATFRNGSMTGIGVVTGFSLNFLTRWGANPVPWLMVDLFAVVPLVAGLLLQVWSFVELLRPESMQLAIYNRAKNHFLLGTIGVLLGVGVALLLDVLQQSAPDMLR